MEKVSRSLHRPFLFAMVAFLGSAVLLAGICHVLCNEARVLPGHGSGLVGFPPNGYWAVGLPVVLLTTAGVISVVRRTIRWEYNVIAAAALAGVNLLATAVLLGLHLALLR